MPSSSRPAALLLLLVLPLDTPEASGGFLGGLKLDPSKIHDGVTHAVKKVSQSMPGQLQDAVKEVAKARPEEVAESVKSALNGTAVKEVAGDMKDAAEKKAGQALHGLTTVGSVAANEVGVQKIEASQAAGKQLSKALQTAGLPLKTKPQASAASLASGEAGSQSPAGPGSAPMAEAAIKEEGKAVLPDSQQGKRYGWLVAGMVVLMLVSILAFAWMKPSGPEPKLLSDLECMQGGFASSARSLSIRAPASESTGFTQF